MKCTAFRLATSLLVLPFLTTLVTQVSAGPARNKFIGDWHLNIDGGGRQRTSILSLVRDKGKNNKEVLAGEWISLWGSRQLSDIHNEGDKLSFVQTYRFRDREVTSRFEGVLQRGKLTGTLSSDRDQYRAEGTRLKPTPRPVGSWATKITLSDREIDATLIIKVDKEGKLTGAWKSPEGEHQITEMMFKQGELSFKQKSKVQDREWESTFTGTIKRQRLSGLFTSERGVVEVEGKRLGSSLIGRWELAIASDSGTRSQCLRVNPDMSGRYGPLAIDKINLEGDRVSFKGALPFSEVEFEISFAGNLAGRKLVGELTTPRGTRKVEGQKRGRAAAGLTLKKLRKPDVIFVPTPQEVVDKMLELARVGKDDLIYDLGCGDGRIVVTAAKKFGCRGVGYDISQKRVRESLANVKKNKVEDLVRIEQEDILTLDLSDANVITLYLLPELNVRLIPQLEKLKPGSRIVSHDFDMKGVKPDKVIEVESGDTYQTSTIYLWTTPLKKEEKETGGEEEGFRFE